MPDLWGARHFSRRRCGRIMFLVILIKKGVQREPQKTPVLETNTFLYKQLRFLSWNRTNTKKTQTWDFQVYIYIYHMYILDMFTHIIYIYTYTCIIHIIFNLNYVYIHIYIYIEIYLRSISRSIPAIEITTTDGSPPLGTALARGSKTERLRWAMPLGWHQLHSKKGISSKYWNAMNYDSKQYVYTHIYIYIYV